MIMSALFIPFTGDVVKVSKTWVGRPQTGDEVVYALFHSVGELLEERWYIYGVNHDAIAVKPENLPEAVRLAHMLLE